MSYAILGLLGLSAFAAVFAGLRISTRRYRAFRSGFLGRAARDLDYLYSDMQADQVLILSMLATVLLALVALLSGMGSVGLVVMVAIGYAAPRAILAQLRSRRSRRFELQLVDGITTIASCLRVGLNLHQAVRTVVDEMESPISEEFGLVLHETRLGAPIEQAIGTLARRMKSEDLDLVVTAISVAHQTGGDLGEIFQNISLQIRERNRVARKLKSMTSAGRLQGLLVAIVPPLLLFWTVVGDPSRAVAHYGTPLGLAMLTLVAILYLLAFVAIRQLTRVES
ncbi:MAG: hypothetical protein CME06_14320 [Gemmatimonadetes bacterium]|nr:hypothetical protein [Gemmatimonadota bacterium]